MEPVSRRYAHSEGLTQLCFSSKRLVSGGSDGYVRVFSGLDGDCKEFPASPGRPVAAMACYRKAGRDFVAIATAGEDFSVSAYTIEGEMDGLLMRFTGQVTHLVASGDHAYLVGGACDFAVKSVELRGEGGGRECVYEGHQAPVLCVACDPMDQYLASTSCDGSVKVWSIKTRECVCSLVLLDKCSDTSLSKSLACLAWQPTHGKLLAVPVGKEVKLYHRDSWQCVCSLEDSHCKVINIVTWSPCGSHVTSGDVGGNVTVWKAADQSVAERFKSEGFGITSLLWEEEGSSLSNAPQLVFADMEGYVGAFECAHGKPASQLTAVEKGLSMEGSVAMDDDSLLMEGIPPDEIFGDCSDDFGDGDHLRDGGGGGRGGGGEGEEDDLTPSCKKQRMCVVEGEEEWNRCDEYSNLSSALPSGHVRDRPVTAKAFEFKEKCVEVYHPPFQPSASPAHLQHRFLVYNLVGMVCCHSDQDGSMVEVEFHDSSVHHPFSVSNLSDYSMAALSAQALALASERSEDSHSQLHCNNFMSWDGSKEWTVDLPSKESITCLAASDGWVAVATNRQLLRVWTVGGVQSEVLSVAGPVVALAASAGGLLALVYCSKPCTQSVFSLNVWVLDLRRKKQLHAPHTLPLSPSSTLEWIGFSSCGLLISYDSKGIVRALSSRYQSSWIPVMNTAKQLSNKSDHYYVVGMTHEPLQLRCVLCKGLHYPPVHPKPAMLSLPLKVPLCDTHSESAELEEQCILSDLVKPVVQAGQTDQTDMSRVQLLMKLFALACRSDREYRSWEVAAMMPDLHSMNLALAYASRSQRVRLARHISQLIQQRSQEHWEEEGEGEEGEEGEGEEGEGWGGHERLGSIRRLSASVAGRGGGAGRGRKEGEERRGFEETQELFSDSDAEDEPEPRPTQEEPRPPQQEPRPHQPTATTDRDSTPVRTGRKSNPFKLSTPVSKQASVKRRSSFLDNISQQMEEQQRKRELRLKPGAKRSKAPAGDKKASKTAKSNKVQSSLKVTCDSRKSKEESKPSMANGVEREGEGEGVGREEEEGGEKSISPSTCTVISSKQRIRGFAFHPNDQEQ